MARLSRLRRPARLAGRTQLSRCRQQCPVCPGRAGRSPRAGPRVWAGRRAPRARTPALSPVLRRRGAARPGLGLLPPGARQRRAGLGSGGHGAVVLGLPGGAGGGALRRRHALAALARRRGPGQRGLVELERGARPGRPASLAAVPGRRSTGAALFVLAPPGAPARRPRPPGGGVAVYPRPVARPGRPPPPARARPARGAWPRWRFTGSRCMCGGEVRRERGRPGGTPPRRRPAPGRAPARAVGLGDVRFRQFRLHHRGHHRLVQRLLRRRAGGGRALGHLCLDRGAGGLPRAGRDQRAGDGRLGRPAWREEASARPHHRGLRALHRPACPRRAGGAVVGRGLPGRRHLLLRRWREPDRRLPAGDRPSARPGPGVRLGLGAGLSGRPVHPGAVPGLYRLGRGAGPGSAALRAGEPADHRLPVRPGQPAHLPLAARARRAGRRGGVGLGAGGRDAAASAPLSRSLPLSLVQPVLPGRHPDGDRAGRRVCHPGPGFHAPPGPGTGAVGERHGGGGGLPVRPPPRPSGPCARHRPDPRLLDRHRRPGLGRAGVSRRPRPVLAGGQPRRPGAGRRRRARHRGRPPGSAASSSGGLCGWTCMAALSPVGADRG